MNDPHYALEPDRTEMARLAGLVVDRAMDFVGSLPSRPAVVMGDPAEAGLVREFLTPPPEDGVEAAEVFARLDAATSLGLESAGPGYLGFVPAGGLYTSALADLFTSVVNRYGSFAAAAPALVALEESVVRWIARDVVGLPEASGGLLTSGGSMANFSAVVAARRHLLGDDLGGGIAYVSDHTHHSVMTAAWLAGIPQRNVRVVPASADLRLDVDAAAAMIAADRRAGLRPFLLAAAAGTTDTGTVDPLSELAELARQEGLWLHVDGAYGGFFALTARGRERLRGIELADSVTLDPHKSLFLPHGVGAVVVRDRRLLALGQAAGTYLQDAPLGDALPDYATMGPELTREVRGLRVWLPLQLHGVGAFRAALDEKLDLAVHADERLSRLPRLELPWRPELSTVAFRVRPDGTGASAVQRADELTRELVAQVNGSGRVFLSSTQIQGRTAIRMCILSHRTHLDRVDEAVGIIESALADFTDAGR